MHLLHWREQLYVKSVVGPITVNNRVYLPLWNAFSVEMCQRLNQKRVPQCS